MPTPHLSLPPLEELHKLFKYDPDSGILSWRTWSKYLKTKPDGAPAGGKTPEGYWKVNIGKTRYFSHRIVVYMLTGEDPGDAEVDHRDGDKSNNRAANLRVGTKNNNQHNRRLNKNSSSGVKGVVWHKSTQHWLARVQTTRNGIMCRKHLGIFKRLEDATEAVRQYREEQHKTFTNHG